MKYFAGCKSIEEVKATYKRLAKKLHPDMGGRKEEFQAMFAEYESAFEHLKNIHQSAGNPGETYYKETTETPAEFAQIINALITIEGIEVELCGRWLWISGDTRTHKDRLKSLGCRWASKKKLWYWHLPEDACGRSKGQSMSEIRSKYGSERITTSRPQAAQLEA